MPIRDCRNSLPHSESSPCLKQTCSTQLLPSDMTTHSFTFQVHEDDHVLADSDLNARAHVSSTDKGQGARLTFSFDDGYKSTIDSTISILTHFGFPASYNIIVDRVGQDGFGSWDDWRVAADQGMEISSHSLTHPFFPSSLLGEVEWLRDTFNLTKEIRRKALFWAYVGRSFATTFRIGKHQLCREIVQSKQMIENNISSLTVESFVYPRGRCNNSVLNMVASAGYSSARSSVGLNSFQHLDPYRLKGRFWLSSTSVEQANKWVREAIESKAWLIEVFHLVGKTRPPDHPLFTSIQKFREHIQYVAKQNLTVDTQKAIVREIGNRKLEHIRWPTS